LAATHCGRRWLWERRSGFFGFREKMVLGFMAGGFLTWLRGEVRFVRIKWGGAGRVNFVWVAC
jgi:hypothetical protein